MTYRKSLLCAAVLCALSAPAAVFSQTAASAVADIDTTEAPRITQAVDARQRVAIAGSHIPLVDAVAATSVATDDLPMNHLQLVLKRSAKREAALKKVIAEQNDPSSPRFGRWLTPEAFGKSFGVTDADLAAAVSYLTAQGFTVNGVYPSHMQIDFSGSAGQVRNAFGVQEKYYAVDAKQHLANAGDVTIPKALSDVVAGVAGLTDLRPQAQHTPFVHAARDPSGTGFIRKPATGTSADVATAKASPQLFPYSDKIRLLTPYDMSIMYGTAPLIASGITGKGITVAVVEDADMPREDWDNFVKTFDLAKYGGTYALVNPPAAGLSSTNCIDPNVSAGFEEESGETLLDAEWVTAMAPGATLKVATCDDSGTNNFFGGVYTAANNLINGTDRPDIISASYGFDELDVDVATKIALDGMWQQAAAEGISVFVSTGDSGVNTGYNGSAFITLGISANALATSPYVTAVGGTDTADVLDKTTATYFAAKPNSVLGSALSYVPEIPWNESCGNDVAAKANGYASAVKFCQAQYATLGRFNTPFTAEGSSGAPALYNEKPAWQAKVHGASKDGARDIPDVALFAGSYGNFTYAVTCDSSALCAPGLPNGADGSGGTSLASPMFAAIQALVNQSTGRRKQGVAATTLYALAADEYGGADGVAPTTLAACDADKGATGTAGCVFHNITRGGISTNCSTGADNCYAYTGPYGLTSITTKKYKEAYPAQPGWSFASGLGSVNAANLAKAWKAYNKQH
jgi:subtilase family serine protease